MEPPKPKITYERLRRAQVIEAFSVAFQMIGGVPRMALWADQNPGEFYKLYSRMLPAPTSEEMRDDQVIEVVHALPAPNYDPTYPTGTAILDALAPPSDDTSSS